jgi:uncharacterized protein
MGVELRPLGIACNLQCQYCYQNPQRDAGNIHRTYDVGLMKEAVERQGGPFTMFGGEPLLVPAADLRELWAWGLERYGQNSIQTNGVLITDEHVQMFKQYKVDVGISFDGPGELNDARWMGTLERTRDATRKTEEAIALLCREGIPPSLILTLHRTNVLGERLRRLQDWLLEIEAIGVTRTRLHILEVDDEQVRAKYALTVEENVETFLSMLDFEARLTSLCFDLFSEMRQLLLGEDERTSCVWNACDTYTTRAVRGVEGMGRASNCGRTNKDGIDFVKSDREGLERYLALYHTPQEYGGCRGCRFFLMCKGQCPGTAIDGDWRNRSEHCEVWKRLFSRLEEDLAAAGHHPLSTSPERERLERRFIELWSAGEIATISAVRQRS